MNGIESENPKEFRNRKAWRKWLQVHGDRNEGLWVLIRKVAGNAGGVLYADAVQEALCAGWIDGKMKSLDAETYKLWFSPRRKGSVWSKLNRERVESLIEEGLMTPRGLLAIDEAKKSGKWQTAYSSRKPPELPPDLKAAFKTDPAALGCFKGLANSYQHQYSGWVAEAKRPETRQRRIDAVLDRVKKNLKPGIGM